MLQLKDIVKQYGDGENKVTALNGVNVSFRENEFVAILGHSGCGKTTMLNIIGGLDHYTSGDLIINGVSTKEYKNRDWDAYRNHSIGFIFQSYNLIPHQSVLANVELALTISGVSKSERRKRAKEALEKVGLGNQIHKRPNQMSGGQMQRVAIARALINNPDILLADEPTGALDSETSIQVMELLKEIAKDKLVIMVTHNPELAEQYATRIVRIKDGQLTSDNDPFDSEEEKAETEKKKKRVSMSFATAVSLSLNNLMTKKGRTLLTSFAGSIGIIGIALILSLSTGINDYIDQVQEDTLSSYPISITKETADMEQVFSIMFGEPKEEENTADDPSDTVYSNTAMYDMFNSLNSSAKRVNNMKKFKKFVDENETIKECANAVSYSYSIQMPIFTKDQNGSIVKSDLGEIYSDQMGLGQIQEQSASLVGAGASNSMMSVPIWSELLPDENDSGINPLLEEQYDVVYGTWPKNYNEVVVVLNERNQLPDMVTYALGLKPADEFGDIVKKAMKNEVIDDYGRTKWSYDEIASQEYKLILPCEYYQKNSKGNGYTDLTKSESGLDVLYNDDSIGTPIKIVGFIKPDPDASSTMIDGYIGYTKELTNRIIEKTNSSELVKAQVADKENDLITGKKFKTDDYKELTDSEKIEKAKELIKNAPEAQKVEIAKFILAQPTEQQLQALTDEYMKPENRDKLINDIQALSAQSMGSENSSGEDIGAVVSFIGEMDDEQFKQFAPQILKEILPMKFAAEAQAELSKLSDEELLKQLAKANVSDSAALKLYEYLSPDELSKLTYEDNLYILGYADIDDPSAVNIYVKSFEMKDKVTDEIAAYNNAQEDEADVIHYTDFVKMLMSSITNIISGISYLLIAFVGISLVVSSIMIGIITYISVLERTREIGILRAIGASKHDVKTVFNAETLLVGLAAGIIGILVSVALTFPINMIIHSLTDLQTLKAHVPVVGAVVLIVISMILTLISGLIPASVAAKKDPVEALRTE